VLKRYFDFRGQIIQRLEKIAQ
jgi:hypothetical protein